MNIARRNFLTGAAGTALCLPALESISAEPAKTAPKRLLNIGFIYGVTKYDQWFPKSTGRNFELTPGLLPLARHKHDFTFFSNIWNQRADGAHDNFGELFNCGSQTKGEAGMITFDQIAARHLGKDTPLSSLQIGGGLSRDHLGRALPGYENPLDVYNRLYGDSGLTPMESKRRIRSQMSIMDTFRAQASRINKRISIHDREKLDEYFQSLGLIEERLAKEELWADRGKPKPPLDPPTVLTSNKGKVHQGIAYIETMFDLIVAAFQTDSTRVVSMTMPLQPMLNDLKCTNNAHAVSHHKQGTKGSFGNANAMSDSMARDKKNAELLAYLFDRLKATKDVDGTSLFDNTIINVASGFRSDHNRKGLPVIHAGGKNCGIKHAGYIELDASREKNRLANLWLTNLQALGLKNESFGDSVGIIEQVLA